MFCKKCHTEPSIKDTEKYISILCKCQITILYPNTKTRTIKKEEYNNKYKKRDQ